MEINVNIGVRPEVNFEQALSAAMSAGLSVAEQDADYRYAHGTIAAADFGKLQRVEGLVIENDRVVSADF